MRRAPLARAMTAGAEPGRGVGASGARHTSRQQVQPQVLSLCKKYNIPYHRTGFWQGTWEVVNRLATVETKSRAL